MSWKDKIVKSVAHAKNRVNENTSSFKSSAASTGYTAPKPVNSVLGEGDTRIRKALNSYGVPNEKIGYREQDGNGIVTVGGKDFITANAVKDGTSYAPLGAIQKAYNKMQSQNGDPIVKVSDYVTSKGLGASLSYNANNDAVSVGGSEFKPSYIDNGISYAPQSVVDKAIDDYQKNTGILNYASLVKKNNEEYGAYTNKLIAALTNREKFSYTPENDPEYLAYKEMYEREAKNAAKEALAGYAAQNGGLGTSAAVSAASQAQSAWLDKLNDVIPTLYQNAYQRYVTDRQDDISALGQLEALRKSKLEDEMSANNAQLAEVRSENNENLARYQNELEKQYTAEDREYQRQFNDISLKEGKLNLDNAEKQSILNNASVRGFFTADEAEALGVDVNENPLVAASRLELYTYDKTRGIDSNYSIDEYAQKLALENQYVPVKTSSGSGRSSSGGGGGSSSSSSGVSKQAQKQISSLVKNFNSAFKSDFTDDYGDENIGDLILADGSGGYYINPNLTASQKNGVRNKVYGYIKNIDGDYTEAAAHLFNLIGVNEGNMVYGELGENAAKAYNIDKNTWKHR